MKLLNCMARRTPDGVKKEPALHSARPGEIKTARETERPVTVGRQADSSSVGRTAGTLVL